MSLETALIIDAATVVGCGLALLIGCHLRLAHPAVLYLGFHVLVFSLRAYGLNNGAPNFLNTSMIEYARALNFADAFLIVATVGWLTAKQKPKAQNESSFWSQPLQSRYILLVAYVAIPIGLYSFLRYAFIPGATAAPDFSAGSYAQLAITWPLLMLVAMIYQFGLRWYLAAPTATLILLSALQGENRYRVILPIIAMAQFQTDRAGRRWPTIRTLFLFAFLFLLFFPLKVIGKSFQEGRSLATIYADALDTVQYSIQGQSSGQAIFDQFATTLSLVDQRGHYFWGQPYLNIFTLPIPRAWWTEKPGLADHILEISTPSRPIGSIGGVTTVPGDLYLNFGLIGMLLGAFVLARISLRFFNLAYESGFGTVGHFLYILFAAASIQVLRDGLFSIYTFVLIKNMPLVAILALHWRGGRKKVRLDDRRRRHSGRFVDPSPDPTAGRSA